MKLPKFTFPEPPPATGGAQPRTFWTSILTATPVILTVFATVLAGLSSSELTLAQYHRSMAAQNQSKASDQWSFFQAKRIRGTEVQRTIRLLQALSEASTLESASFNSIDTSFLENLRRIDKETSRFLDAIGPAKASLGQGSDALLQQVTKLKSLLARTNGARENLRREWERNDIQHALRYVTTNELPPVTISSIQESGIGQAVQSVRARHPESELAPLVSGIADSALRQAIQQANDNIAVVEGADKPIAFSLERLDLLVQKLVAFPPILVRSARELKAASTDLVSENDKTLEALRRSAAAIANSTEALRASANEFHHNFIVAEDSYTVRRYEREARANESAAALYEIQVRKSDLNSDWHRRRSKLFFYGMLAAQAGVTIAAFSLALKHRSLLWSLATCAGLGAVLFGAYVYWYM
jgi:hypothetical protein